jgi:hypothetical protein
MSTNEFWKKISYSPSSYFDEFPLNLVNEVLAEDVDRFDSIAQLIKKENEEQSLSPISCDVSDFENDHWHFSFCYF